MKSRTTVWEKQEQKSGWLFNNLMRTFAWLRLTNLRNN